MKQPLKHILVVRLSAMGDVAMTVPVLLALSKAHPDLKITVLSKAFFKPIFDGVPNLEFYSAETKGRHRGILGIYKLAQEIKKLNVDAVADFHNVLRSNVLIRILRLSGIRYAQIDKGRAEKKALIREDNKVFKQLKTSHQRYAEVLKTLGFSINLENVDLLSNKSLEYKIQHLVSEKTIGVAPFAAHVGKQYPLQKMKQIIAELSQEYHVLLFGGGKTEVALLEDIEKVNSNVVSVAGKYSLEEELTLMSQLKIMVSMDSGNGHLAANFGVPVITIWGITHPFAGFAPFNQPEEHQLIPDLEKFSKIPTSVYGNKYPDGYLDCFNTITPQDIIKAIKKASNS